MLHSPVQMLNLYFSSYLVNFKPIQIPLPQNRGAYDRIIFLLLTKSK